MKKKGEKGIVLIESSFSIVIMLGFLAGFYGTSQVLLQAFWCIQTSYQAAYLGAETTDADARLINPRNLINKLTAVQNSNDQRMVALESVSTPLINENNTQRLLSASFSGTTYKFFGNKYTLSSKMTASLLVPDSSIYVVPTFSSSRSNGSFQKYSCCGNVGYTPSDCITESGTDYTYQNCTGMAVAAVIKSL